MKGWKVRSWVCKGGETGRGWVCEGGGRLGTGSVKGRKVRDWVCEGVELEGKGLGL